MRYAHWLNEYMVYLESEFDTPITASPIDINDQVRGIDFQNPGGWTPEEQLVVRGLILQIRTVESNVYHPEDRRVVLAQATVLRRAAVL